MLTAAVTRGDTIRALPFYPYPQAFLSAEDDLVALFREVGRRGAFILQEDGRCFEDNLARFLGARHALGVANATDGLLLALRAAGVRPGDEVIFSSHTMVATAAAIHFCGAVPVPVECGEDHLMDPEAAAAALTPRTTALLPTQLNGRTADMAALGRLAERHGLTIVEDAAQALGSRFRGQCAGTFGAAAAISFYPAKLLGCLGDGGAVITNDGGIATRVAEGRDHGRGANGDVVGWGMNSRLDNLQAAILDYRLQRFNAAVERRRMLARTYRAALHGVAEVVLPPGPADDPDHFDVFQNYEIEAERRDELREHLRAQGIGTLLPWGGRAVHQWEALGLRRALPVTEKLFGRVLLLPMHPWLATEDVAYVGQAIRKFYGGGR
jgi:dTDP-4-amino-4,6-dideoxygalactose transaminase